MAADHALTEQLRAAVKGRRSIVEKKMFGGICWMLNGNMLCGVHKDRYMFRVGPELEREALARDGASPMDITGKPMRGFVWVTGDAAQRAGIETWIALAERYIRALPAKSAAQAPRRKVPGSGRKRAR
ncbi:MAG: TfoX/Sxy family protein [Myxococcota bacterium]